MLISSIPQATGLQPLFPPPDHLTRPEFIANAVVDDGFDGHTSETTLYQCNEDVGMGMTKVIAVFEFGTAFVQYYRKVWTLNCSVADDIRRMSNIKSITFRSEWL